MSDNWITLVPEDPFFVPEVAKQRTARARFSEITPTADEIEINVFENVAFFDCGGNLEHILCPSCKAEIPIEWWQDRMDEDNDDGFKLAAYTTPCCGNKSTLNDFIYNRPQAFGRFALDAMNPSLGKLDDKYKCELEEILGTRLRVVYQHI